MRVLCVVCCVYAAVSTVVGQELVELYLLLRWSIRTLLESLVKLARKHPSYLVAASMDVALEQP